MHASLMPERRHARHARTGSIIRTSCPRYLCRCSPLAPPLRPDGCFTHAHGRANRAGSRRTDAAARSPADEVLVEVGDKAVPFFVVVSGADRDPASVRRHRKRSIVTHRAGQFLGEGNMITGRRAIGARARHASRARSSSSIASSCWRWCRPTPELSEILMRAFILRRVELIARGLGDVVLIGSAHCAGTLRVKEFLTRNGHPLHVHRSRSRRRGAGAARSVSRQRRPTCLSLICRGDAVLRNPSNQRIAECLGLQRRHRSDGRCAIVVIVGAGPAGLAAAVYGASGGPRRRSSSNRTSPAARPDRAPGLRTISGFRRAFQDRS